MFSRILKSLVVTLLMGLPFSMFSQVVADFEANVKQGCIPLQVTYTNRSTVAGVAIDTSKYIFRWNMDETQNTDKIKAKVNAMYVNAGKKTITLTILNLDGTAVAGAQASKTYTNLITVYPNPSVQAIVDKATTCVNDVINFSPKSLTTTSAPLVRYMWDFGDGSPYEFTQNTSHAYTTKASFNATVYATDTNGCSSTKATSKSVTVIVNSDRPISDFTMSNDKTCNASLAVNFTNTSTFANGKIIGYKWDYSDGTSDTNKNTSKTFTRTSNQDTKAISLYVYGNNGCSSIPKTTYVTLYKLDPQITITDALKTVIPQAACPGAVSFSTPQDNGTSYLWQVVSLPSQVVTATNFTNSFNTNLASGSYTVSVTASNPACSLTVSKTFAVEPIIDFGIIPNGSFDCGVSTVKPLRIDQSSLVSGLGIASSRWYINADTAAFSVNLGITGPIHTFLANAAYDLTVKVTTNNGCKGMKTFPQTISVFKPDVAFKIDTNNLCAPHIIGFTNQSTYNVLPSQDFISTVTWNFGDGSPVVINPVSVPVPHNYLDSGIYTVNLNLKTDKGCDFNVTHQVRMGKKPTLNITFKNQEVCGGYSITKTINKSGVSYIDNSTVIDSTYAQFLNVNSKRGASTVINKNINTGDVLHASFNNSQINDTGMYYLQISDFYHGCRVDSVYQITKDLIHVQGPIIYHDPWTINCADPYKVEIKGDTIRSATSWNFKVFKDALPQNILLQTINSPTKKLLIDFEPFGYGTGSYTSILHAINTTTNCEDSSTIHFTITKPKAVLTVADTQKACVSSTHLLSHLGLKDIDYISSSIWKLIAPDGSIDSADIHSKVRVHQHKINTLSFDKNGNNVYFVDSASNLINESVTLTQRGIYGLYFKITDINNCTDDTLFSFRSYQPKAAFTVAPVTDCLPITVPFTDASIVYLRPIVSREWHTNGDTAQFLTGNKLTVSDKYREQKQYSIKLKVTDDYGCSDSVTNPNGVTPIIPPATIIPVGKVCLGTEAEFKVDASMGSLYTASVDSFVWDFGDGTHLKTTLFTAKHTYATEMTYPQVTVKAYKTAPSTHVCYNADTNRTTDIKDAHANFSYADTKSNPDSCKYAFFSLNVAYASRYNEANWWEKYGNTITSRGDKSSPNISFGGFGDHIVWLQTTSDYKGCETDSNGFKHTIPQSTYKITNDKSDVCVKELIHFGLIDTVNVGRYNHWWTFEGDTDMTHFDISHAFHKLSKDGKSTVYFHVENGCPNFDTVSIVVQQVMAKFDRGLNDSTTKGCAPFSVAFVDSSQGALSYNWDFGDGTTETTASPTHIFKGAGKIYTVTLNIQGQKCNDNYPNIITTYDKPDFTSNYKNFICQDSVLTITLKPKPGTEIVSWQNDPSILSVSADKLEAVVKPQKANKYIISEKYTTVALGDSPCPLDTALLIDVQLRPVYKGAPYNYLVYLPKDTLFKKPKNELFPYITYSLNNSDTLPDVLYKWTPSTWLSCDDCVNPTIRVEEDKDVQYIVTMTNTCFSINDTLNFKLIAETAAGLPSAFTPNSGKNDFAIPRGWGVKDFLEIDIYNRWGQLVYKSDKMFEGWDGTFNGRPQDPDTYAWTIRFKDSKDIVQEKKGYITLLR
jgi:gliding motility-associated-like protein